MENHGVRVVSLDCPGCGATLQVAPSLSQLACGYCGKVATVERTGGTITLLPEVAAIERVQAGTHRTAAQLPFQVRNGVRPAHTCNGQPGIQINLGTE